MGDLAQRNTDIMIAEAKRMQAQVAELRGMVGQQNKKITTLSNEIALLKQQQVFNSIQLQIAEKGHGGTA